MQKVRNFPKTVLLPNRMVLIVGGEGNFISEQDPHPGENSSEIFNPSNETFGSLLDIDETNPDINRRYHSEAFLLPDGRVITAGDDPGAGSHHVDVGDENGATYNVYYPTYMSPASARPTILTWPVPPTEIEWGTSFDVCVSGIVTQADLDSVILVRPSSTTHSVDFDHRQVQLPADYDGGACGPGGNKIIVTLPASGAGDWKKHVLPPGYYMLIVRKVNAGGPPIPSVAKFVKLVKP